MQDKSIENWISAACEDGFDPAAHGWLSDDHEPVDLPLQDSVLRDVHASLSAWHSPAKFQATVKTLHRRSSPKMIFNNPRQKFLLDAWTLAKFAVRLKAVDQVRLSGPNEQWPDGYVRADGKIKNVEITIALMPGRKMGEEYKVDTGIEFDPVEDWVARADAIPQALEKAIGKKIAKRYGSGAWLVVYLNLDEYGIRQNQTELVIAQVKRQHAQAFVGLFVLWKDKIY